MTPYPAETPPLVTNPDPPADPAPAVTPPHAGMPPLDESADGISVFEFAPAWLFYMPVIFYCLWLAIRHRGWILPTAANPALPFSGWVGESKFDVLETVGPDMRGAIAACTRVDRAADDTATLSACLEAMQQAGLAFPLVAKPDIGMRGAGVQKIAGEAALSAYIADFPVGARIMLQALVDQEGEAGVFYMRIPGEARGRILSLTLKYFPRLVGDGRRSVRQLIADDPRAGKLPHLYEDRFADRLDTVLPEGETLRLAFAGNHCRGTIFRDGTPYVTEALTHRFDALARSIGEFYIGRVDVRFDRWDRFLEGEGFTIIEINGAGGEPTHIWDARTRLMDAYRALFQQYGSLYRIGAANRRRGFTPSRIRDLLAAWRHERALTGNYPETH